MIPNKHFNHPHRQVHLHIASRVESLWHISLLGEKGKMPIYELCTAVALTPLVSNGLALVHRPKQGLIAAQLVRQRPTDPTGR